MHKIDTKYKNNKIRLMSQIAIWISIIHFNRGDDQAFRLPSLIRYECWLSLLYHAAQFNELIGHNVLRINDTYMHDLIDN